MGLCFSHRRVSKKFKTIKMISVSPYKDSPELIVDKSSPLRNNLCMFIFSKYPRVSVESCVSSPRHPVCVKDILNLRIGRSFNEPNYKCSIDCYNYILHHSVSPMNSKIDKITRNESH